jgi:opacity protein-like surface antigen
MTKHSFFTGLAMLGLTASAEAQVFSGPYLGIEAAHEAYDPAPDGDWAFAAHAGWDFRVRDAWVVGGLLRFGLDGVDSSTTSVTPGGVLATADVAIEDQIGGSVRAGRVIGERVLVFAEAGYERFHANQVRTLRNQVCAPPNGCLISRQDFSFDDDMWTIGAGAEWAVTQSWRVRASYQYGDSKAFERNRVSLSTSFAF